MTDRTSVAVVLCCLVGLIVAGAASPAIGLGGGEVRTTPPAPPTPAEGGAGPGGGDMPGGGSGDGEETDGPEAGDGGGGRHVPGAGCQDDDETCRIDVGRPCEPGEPCRAAEGVQLSITPDPVPGRRVTVLVRVDGSPASGVAVDFNRPDGGFRTIGQTGSDGRVSGQVPYVERLWVQLRFPDSYGAPARVRPDAPGGGPPAIGPDPTEPEIARMSLIGAGDGGGIAQRGTPATETPENGTAVDLPTRVHVETDGRRLPGEMVTVRATIDGVPVRNAAVTVDGETVGRTTADGEFRLKLPDDGAVRTRVEITRGAIEVTETIRVRALKMRLRPRDLLAVPGGTVEVTTLVAGEPEGDIRVYRDGQYVGTTDADGQLPVEVPWNNRIDLRASALQQTTTVVVDWLYLRLGLVVGIPLAIVTGLGLAARRRLQGGVGESTPSPSRVARLLEDLPALVGTRLQRLATALGRLIAAVARGLAALGGRIGAFLHAVGARTTRLLRTVGRGIATLDGSGTVAVVVRWWQAGRSWVSRRAPRAAVASGVGRVGAAVMAVLAALRSFSVVACWDFLRRVFTREGGATDTGSDDETGSGTGTVSSGGGVGPETPPSLQELWQRFARRVVPRRWRTSTPGEIARAGRDRGLPTEAVDQLTEAFRLAEYAPDGIDAESRERARRAYDRLETAMREDGERTS